MKLTNNTTRCCCCFSLERGISTAAAVFNNITSIQNHDYRDIVLVYLVINASFLLALIFGIFVCCCARTGYLLGTYSTLYNIFTAIEIIYTIVVIIVLIIDKDKIVNSCSISLTSSNPSVNDPLGTCNSQYSQIRIIMIVAYILTALILIHFAMVISAYTARCKNNSRE
ncbi:hypothetical protein F8M41_014758 [Gigaspora margarita]|uniref:Uncharacterized protein n=1 Tax=Gigaspora margarita TaxID=4874 RepID=A0A8H4ENV6_GIGMA|nr:hypothetical protein F8M41_014758 [Gigaspora margarita]